MYNQSMQIYTHAIDILYILFMRTHTLDKIYVSVFMHNKLWGVYQPYNKKHMALLYVLKYDFCLSSVVYGYG